MLWKRRFAAPIFADLCAVGLDRVLVVVVKGMVALCSVKDGNMVGCNFSNFKTQTSPIVLEEAKLVICSPSDRTFTNSNPRPSPWQGYRLFSFGFCVTSKLMLV